MNIIALSYCSLVIPEIGRRAYVNSIRGRTELYRDLKGKHDSLFAEVLAVWGDTPTVDDDPASFSPSLAERKTSKLADLDASFRQRVSGSFLTSQGYTMQFDVSDSLKMQGAVTLLEAASATEGYLTQADDVTVYHVPLATMKAVLVEMLATYAACHAKKQELRATINEATTAEELNAIQITWPV